MVNKHKNLNPNVNEQIAFLKGKNNDTNAILLKYVKILCYIIIYYNYYYIILLSLDRTFHNNCDRCLKQKGLQPDDRSEIHRTSGDMLHEVSEQ